MIYTVYSVVPGVGVTALCTSDDPLGALEKAKREHPGVAVSVNKSDRPPPSLRAGMIVAGISSPMTAQERRRTMNSRRTAELARGRWLYNNKRKQWAENKRDSFARSSSETSNIKRRHRSLKKAESHATT